MHFQIYPAMCGRGLTATSLFSPACFSSPPLLFPLLLHHHSFFVFYPSHCPLSPVLLLPPCLLIPPFVTFTSHSRTHPLPLIFTSLSSSLCSSSSSSLCPLLRSRKCIPPLSHPLPCHSNRNDSVAACISRQGKRGEERRGERWDGEGNRGEQRR